MKYKYMLYTNSEYIYGSTVLISHDGTQYQGPTFSIFAAKEDAIDELKQDICSWGDDIINNFREIL